MLHWRKRGSEREKHWSDHQSKWTTSPTDHYTLVRHLLFILSSLFLPIEHHHLLLFHPFTKSSSSSILHYQITSSNITKWPAQEHTSKSCPNLSATMRTCRIFPLCKWLNLARNKFNEFSTTPLQSFPFLQIPTHLTIHLFIQQQSTRRKKNDWCPRVDSSRVRFNANQ